MQCFHINGSHCRKIGVCFFFGYRLESRAAINQVLLIQQKKQRRISLLLNTSHQRGSLVLVYTSLLQTSGYTTFFCKPYIQLSHSKTKQYTNLTFSSILHVQLMPSISKKSYHIAAAFTEGLANFLGVNSTIEFEPEGAWPLN